MTRPYILFNNNAQEAINFYAEIFGASKQVSTFRDLPPDPRHPAIPEEALDRVLHGSIKFKDNEIMFCDNPFPKDDRFKPSGFVTIALDFDTVDETKAVYDKLTVGGDIHHPLESTFFADAYSWFTDKLGVSWQLICGMKM